MVTGGSRLGDYEIGAQLGAGGMGEVYRATDTVLKRQVALKVLPPEVANDAARVARVSLSEALSRRFARGGHDRRRGEPRLGVRHSHGVVYPSHFRWGVQSYGGVDAGWQGRGIRLNENGHTERVLATRRRNAKKMMAVDVTTEPVFSYKKPRVLFENEYVTCFISPAILRFPSRFGNTLSHELRRRHH
jgi:serine/threonine protein kinase